ncbi:MAG TPA: competence type IV pilus minor pilin ComGE [Bacillaceae bacterium]
MSRNEKGFTFLEGLAAFAILLVVAASLLPLMFRMLAGLQEEKKEMTAARLLYEHVEKAKVHGLGESEERTIIRNVQYELTYEAGEGGKERACVRYENKQSCLE